MHVNSKNFWSYPIDLDIFLHTALLLLLKKHFYIYCLRIFLNWGSWIIIIWLYKNRRCKSKLRTNKRKIQVWDSNSWSWGLESRALVSRVSLEWIKNSSQLAAKTINKTDAHAKVIDVWASWTSRDHVANFGQNSLWSFGPCTWFILATQLGDHVMHVRTCTCTCTSPMLIVNCKCSYAIQFIDMEKRFIQ